MRTLVESVIAQLASRGLTAYWLEAPKDGITWPYVLIWGTSGQMATESVGCVQDHLSDRLGVTYVSQSALGVLDVARRGRAAMTGWSPTSSTWHVEPLTVVDSQNAQPDRDVILPATGTHPYYAVDLYSLVGSPI